jgi:beta-N-acetylhexosaminidase
MPMASRPAGESDSRPTLHLLCSTQLGFGNKLSTVSLNYHCPVRLRLPAFLAVITMTAAGCSLAHRSTAGPSPSTKTSSTASSSTQPRPPSTRSSPPRFCSERVFATMSEAERVGQLFSVGLRSNRLGPAEVTGIRHYHFGSVWFTQTTTDGVPGVRRVADAVQALATKANTGGVRFYVAVNQEGGVIQTLRGSGFSAMPTAVGQGRLSPSTLQTDAQNWGRELLAAGVNLNFAPVMDVVPAGGQLRNQPIGVLKREYGSDPDAVGAHGVAFLRGMARAGVTTTAKHFPGLGRVVGNTDFTANVVDSETTPNDPYLRPFRQAIDAGVPIVMVALATYTRIDPDHLAVFSPVVLRLLRKTYGFHGVIASDDIGAATAISDIPAGVRAIDFLEAGGDLIVSKYVQPANQMAEAILARARSDPAFRSRLDDAAMRVLRVKQASSLLPCGG